MCGSSRRQEPARNRASDAAKPGSVPTETLLIPGPASFRRCTGGQRVVTVQAPFWLDDEAWVVIMPPLLHHSPGHDPRSRPWVRAGMPLQHVGGRSVAPRGAFRSAFLRFPDRNKISADASAGGGSARAPS